MATYYHIKSQETFLRVFLVYENNPNCYLRLDITNLNDEESRLLNQNTSKFIVKMLPIMLLCGMYIHPKGKFVCFV